MPVAHSPVLDCWHCRAAYDRALPSCPGCGKRDAQKPWAGPDIEGSLGEDLIGSFSWALRGVVPLTVKITVVFLIHCIYLFASLLPNVLGQTLVSTSVYLAVFWIGFIYVLGLSSASMMSAVRSGAGRQEDFADLPSLLDFADIFRALVQTVSLNVVCLLPGAVLTVAGAFFHSAVLKAIAIPVVLTGAVFLYLGFLLTAVHRSLSAFSPIGIIQVIRRCPGPVARTFLGLTLALGLSAATTWYAHRVLPPTADWWVSMGVNGLAAIVGAYFMFVKARMLGVLYFHHQDDFENPAE